jgi:hypothetical protein
MPAISLFYTERSIEGMARSYSNTKKPAEIQR